jgi:hypothetical protein
VAKSIDSPGFLIPLLHGAIAPIAFVTGSFIDVRMYAFPNSGIGYDLGFLVGIGIFVAGFRR